MMQHPSFAELFRHLNETDESVKIEAKRGSDLGKSIIETLSSFSNEPGLEGGYLLLGVERDHGALPGLGGYRVCGIPDPDTLQQSLVSVSQGTFNERLRPEISVEQYEGQSVLVVYVPEFAPERKPIYLVKAGLPKGAYRRIGSSDVRCTDDDLAVFYGERGFKPHDGELMMDADFSDLDPLAIAHYRTRRGQIKPDATELEENDEAMLQTLGCLRASEGVLRPTVAGLLLFGKRTALRRLMPTQRIEYIVVPGREWSEGVSERVVSSDFLESLVTALPRIESLVSGDLPKTTELPRRGVSARTVAALPERVLREAIVNAAMHRDYRLSSAIQIVRYTNRLEIQNAGYSLKSPDRLLESRSVARNPAIAEVLRDLNLAEAKGTGIGRMTRAMRTANLTVPLIESDRGESRFGLTLSLHHLMSEDDVAWLAGFADCDLSDDEAKILVLVRQLGKISNRSVRDATGLDTLIASQKLKRLRDLELLVTEGKSTATVYRPGPRMGTTAPDAGELEPLGGELEPLGGELEPLGGELLPPELQAMVARLGSRASGREAVEETIIALLRWRPMTSEELGANLNRGKDKLRDNYLTPMVQAGRLRRLRPEPSDPRQCYAVDEDPPD